MLIALLQLSHFCWATVVPYSMFQKNMILQRDKPVAVWGTAEIGETVTVRIAGRSATTTANGDGKWLLYLDPVSADGKTHTLTIEGNDNTVTLSNVLYGDIYLGSGQSNMDRPINTEVEDVFATIQKVNIPQIRLLKVSQTTAAEPLDKVRATWTLCNSSTAKNFSALLYFFGVDLYENTGVPIGLIQSAFGGSYIHAWHPNLPDVDYNATCYNAMIAPLMPFTLNGILWYQGESDAGSATRSAVWGERYAELIQLWRTGFKQPNLPFFCTQVANFEWLYLYTVREGQYQSMNLPNCGCTTAVDIGDTYDIHPKSKHILGPRFGLWIRKFLYGQDVAFTGPLWNNAMINGDAIDVTFDYVGSGLTAKNGRLEGFEIAGLDEDYVTAEATIISSNTVRISASSITDPMWVRYAWVSDPAITLYGGDELPALPFIAAAGTTGPKMSFDPELVNTNTPPAPALPAPYQWGNVVLDLPFDEGNGTIAKDRSGSNHDGAITGTTWTSGKEGSALHFTSENDYVKIPFTSKLALDTFTAAAWIKLDEIGSYINIMSCLKTSFGWKFIVDRSGNSLGLAWFDGKLTTTKLAGLTPLETNTWYHVAVVVKNGGTVSFYVNGILDGVATMPSKFAQSDTPLTIGGKGTGWYGGAFKGSIDTAFLCNHALTASQVADLSDGIYPTPVQLSIEHQDETLELTATNLSRRAMNRLQISTNLMEGWSDYSTFNGTTATNWSFPITATQLLFRIESE